MKIHEYQAHNLFNQYNIKAQNGILIDKKIDENFNQNVNFPCIVKAQIHSGGRGKAGGVKFCKNKEEFIFNVNEMLGKTLYTKQVPQGKICNKVYVVDAKDLEKEIYLSMTLSAENENIVVVASSEGGTEIEEIAKNSPEKIITFPIPFEIGIKDYHAKNIAYKLGIEKVNIAEFESLLKNMYRMFIEKDCSLIEINPLIEYSNGGLFALDAKVNFDDNALMRHSDILALRDIEEENPKEVKASEFDLNYIALEGNIGCLVNGAGLAMATMDTIKAFGGEPANFLDVGGSATTEKVCEAFKILLSDNSVKAILVNIFGGIMKCDVIAQGIVEASKLANVNIPLVVRLDGTNSELGKKIINESGLNIVSAVDMEDAVKKAVASVGGEK